MRREDHQPAQHVEKHVRPSQDELERTCGKTAALICAIDCAATPLVVRFDDGEEPVVCDEGSPLPRPLQRYRGASLVSQTVLAAARSRFPVIGVLAGGSSSVQERIIEEARAVGSEEGVEVRAFAYDPEADANVTLAAHGFCVNEITKGVLDRARDLAQADPAIDSVLILSCDQVRIAAYHVHKVCKAFREDPSLDMVASWIEKLRRTPLLFSRRFLEKLDESPLVSDRCDGSRPIPRLSVREILFGEERLAANAAVPKGVSRFLGEVTLSALEAIGIAEQDLPADSRNAQRTQDAGKASVDGSEARQHSLSAADRLLVSLARDILLNVRGGMSADERAELDAADEWAQRNACDFPLIMNAEHRGKLAYLDSAATTQRVQAAIEAQTRFDTEENANIYRGSYELSAHATNLFDEARSTLERFIGARDGEAIFTMNATASANLVAHAWGEWNIGEGDLIVSTVEDHHSNILPWLMLAQRKGARVAYVGLDENGRLDQTSYRRLLEEHPKLVCVSHISNVLGLENPVRAMALEAHRAGARFYLDAAQSLPHVKLGISDLGIDFAGFSAHKMYGPLGIGGLWVGPSALEEMDPLSGGGGVLAHMGLHSYYLRKGAAQFEPGTPPVSQAISWAATISYLEKLGMDAVARHSATMTRYLVRGLQRIDNVTVWGDHSQNDGQNGLVSFTVAGIDPSALGRFCGKLGVAIRSGGHCAVPLSALMGVTGTGRASIAVHTGMRDIEALLTAVAACRQVYETSWKEGR